MESRLHPQTMHDLMTKPYVEPQWAIDEWLIKGEPALVIGEPKAFKSTLALDMAVSLSTGTPFMGTHDVAEAVPVLYIQEENNLPIVVPQLWALMERAGQGRKVAMSNGQGGFKHLWEPAEGVVEPPFYLSIRTGWKGDKQGGDEVVEFCNEHGIKYIFIDPFYKVNPLGKFNNPDDVQPLLDTLTRIENEISVDTAVVLVHHANKSNTTGGQRIMGSQLIWAWGANNIYMTKSQDTDGHKIRVAREFRGKAEPDDVWLRFSPDFYWTEDPVTLDVMGKANSGRKSEGYAGWVVAFEAGHLKNNTKIQTAEAFKVSPRTITNWETRYRGDL